MSLKPLSASLQGNQAFYNHPDYIEVSQQELAKCDPLPPVYAWNTESKIKRIAKLIFSIIFFPLGIYQIFHSIIGKFFIIPAAIHTDAHEYRQKIDLTTEWKYKRFTVSCDGLKIDALLVGKAATLGNGRWVLSSCGNGDLYETSLFSHDFKHILTEIKGNAIVFNYPGVGASCGMVTKAGMIKSYRAMLTFLEDQNKGIGAKEIVGFGYSIGGGVQGESLKVHALKPDIKYVFIKNRSFASLALTVEKLISKINAWILIIFNWNFESVESSKKLKSPEIIIQSANVKSYEVLNDSQKVTGDGVIAAAASLAHALLSDQECPKDNKVFVGVKEFHSGPLKNPTFIASKINHLFALAA